MIIYLSYRLALAVELIEEHSRSDKKPENDRWQRYNQQVDQVG